MSVSIEDVRAIASLARLGVDDETARALTKELNAILGHMEQLGKVDTSGVAELSGLGAAIAPLRDDVVAPSGLVRRIDEFAPKTRDGFFLVPRLDTHDDPEASS